MCPELGHAHDLGTAALHHCFLFSRLVEHMAHRKYRWHYAICWRVAVVLVLSRSEISCGVGLAAVSERSGPHCLGKASPLLLDFHHSLTPLVIAFNPLSAIGWGGGLKLLTWEFVDWMVKTALM